MTRGSSKPSPAGERRCLVQGERADRASLIRFVLSPDGVVTPDLLERLEGRGVWVSTGRDALNEAVRKKLFARGFKREVVIPDGLVDTIEAGLVARVASLISMARKAGQAVCGAQKTMLLLQNDEVRLLFQASDGSEREKRNLSYRDMADSTFECLDRHELGMAFGRENVVHAALTGGALTNRVKDEANRLRILRQGSEE